MTAQEDATERTDGRPGVYGVVDKPDVSIINPFAHGGFGAVEQYRYPIAMDFGVSAGVMDR
jgi:hypothetical protein